MVRLKVLAGNILSTIFVSNGQLPRGHTKIQDIQDIQEIQDSRMNFILL